MAEKKVAQLKCVEPEVDSEHFNVEIDVVGMQMFSLDLGEEEEAA